MNSTGLLFVVVPVALAVALTCAVVAVRAGKPPRSRSYVVQAAALGVLAGLAPISVVIFLRLSWRVCIVLNLLGLPWAEPWREIAHWTAGAIWAGSTIMLVIALARPSLRRAGIAMLMWSAIIAMPTFFLYFLTVYGDPGIDCIRG
jgi:hypothetical protein